MIGGKGVTAHEKAERHVNICMNHRVLYPSMQGGYTCILELYVLLDTSYIKRPLVFKE